jgi:dihydrofolate synthase / folylpolyglutamate synthase
VLDDKDWKEMLRVLAPQIDRFVLTLAPTAPAERRWNLDRTVQAARELGIDATAIPNFDLALEETNQGSGTVVITGSFHTVGDAMVRLQLTPGPG